MTYQIENQTLTIENNRVWANGSVMKLSTRAHAALILFLQSNGQVLSKEHLMQQLWQGVVVSDDSLFKVIQEIRSAFKRMGVEAQVLNNVYGQGYQWVLPTANPKHANKLRMAWVIVPLVLVIGLLFWFKPQAEQSQTDAVFEAQVRAIKAGEGVELPELDDLNKRQPLDFLKANYLHALKLYLSGQYEQSIKLLNDGLDSKQVKRAHWLQGDAHYLLAKMYIYRDDKDTLKNHLDDAERIYQQVDDADGLLDVAIERARYHQVLLEFEYSIELLYQVADQARAAGDDYHELKAMSNLAYAYQQLNQPEQRQAVLEQSLELALALADGRYAAFSYGELAEIYADLGNHERAMKHAELALRHVVNQHDTNVFQQGFSAFYQLLQPFGHTQLAEKYLQQAIDVQAHFNDEGVLVVAELDLAQVLITQGNHQDSLDLLHGLMREELTLSEQQQTQAMVAYNKYHLKDNIGAYTGSRPVIEASDVSRLARLYAQSAFVLSAWQLERSDEARQAMQHFAEWVNQDNANEMFLFLSVADQVADELGLSQWSSTARQQAKQDLINKTSQIKNQTRPDQELLQSLDNYLHNIKAL